MSVTLQPYCDTYEAGQDLSTKQYYFVAQATDGQVDPCGDGAQAVGILQNTPSAAGQAAQVATIGISRVKAKAAFEEGVLLGSDAAGLAITATTGEFVLAQAKEPAAAEGDIVRVQLMISGAKVP